MQRSRRYRNWAWPTVALIAGTAFLGLWPQVGFPRGAPNPLWTERPAVTAEATPTDWVTLAHDIKPTVVNIRVTRAEGRLAGMPQAFDDPRLHDFFPRFFGERPRELWPQLPKQAPQSVGSGFVVNADGYIVTNHHVVEGAQQIQVTLADGREFAAKVVGRDVKTDLALVKIEAAGLAVIPFGDSDALRVGEPVMAIGNPFGLEHTVTTGIVSATGRVIGEGPYDDFIQTDASINPGNSGGPLINAHGEVVGINTAIFSHTGGSVGIGFAIPVNLAKSVVTQLANTGQMVRGWLGVTIQPLTPALAETFGRDDTAGALVSAVMDDSPAHAAGLTPGDIIVQFDGRAVERAHDLPGLVAARHPGETVEVAVVREGQTVQLTVQIGRLAESAVAAQAEPDADTGRLGLVVEPLTPARAQDLSIATSRGVLVRQVEPGSPAARAGIQPRDVIVEVNRQPVETVQALTEQLQHHNQAAPLLLLVRRDTGALYLTVRT